MAPEIRGTEKYTGELSDIFSLGVVLFTMYFGDEPWSSTKTQDENFQKYKKKRINLFLNKQGSAQLYRNKKVPK